MGKKIIMLLCRCCSQQIEKDQKLNVNIAGSSRSSRASSVSRGRSRSPIRRSVPPQRVVTPPPPPPLLPSGVPMPPPVPSGVPSRRVVGGDDAIVEYVPSPSPMQPRPLPPPRHPPPPAVPGPRMRSSWSSHELPPPPPSPLVTGQACVLVPRKDSDAHLAGKKKEKKHKKKNKSKKKVSQMAPPPGQKVVYVKKMPKTDRATSSMAPPPGQMVVRAKKMPKLPNQKATFRGKGGKNPVRFRWSQREEGHGHEGYSSQDTAKDACACEACDTSEIARASTFGFSLQQLWKPIGVCGRF